MHLQMDIVLQSATRDSRFCRSIAAVGWISALCCCCCVGCRNSTHQLETAPVSGKVVLDGKVLDQGTIVFISPRGRTSTGEIGADGTFTLSTYVEGDGAIVGENRVAVFVGTSSELENALPVKSPVPARYGSVTTSGLSFEVKPGQANEFVVELTSRP